MNLNGYASGFVNKTNTLKNAVLWHFVSSKAADLTEVTINITTFYVKVAKTKPYVYTVNILPWEKKKKY